VAQLGPIFAAAQLPSSSLSLPLTTGAHLSASPPTTRHPLPPPWLPRTAPPRPPPLLPSIHRARHCQCAGAHSRTSSPPLSQLPPTKVHRALMAASTELCRPTASPHPSPSCL
jgi:hypothetical protein